MFYHFLKLTNSKFHFITKARGFVFQQLYLHPCTFLTCPFFFEVECRSASSILQRIRFGQQQYIK